MSPSPHEGIEVDIVIANHNYGDFLIEAIDSARRQDHPYVSVVVVDDGSTDDSRERLRTYDGAVEVVLKENGGQASAINAGVARCRGDVVMLLDADDVLKPQAARRVAAVFAADPAVARVQFRMDVIDAVGRPTGVTKPQPHIPMPNGDLRAAELMFPFDLSWVATSGHAFRADALRRILPIPERDYPRCGADWYLVHLIGLLGSIVSLHDVGASYRVHGRNSYEPQAPSLELEHVRETIEYSRTTARALARLADELSLEHPDPIISMADVGNRLISHRLQPELHPVRTDSTTGLVTDAIRAACRRFDISWPMKLMFVAWCMALTVTPRRVACLLAELFLFPERRPSLNRLLSRLHRDPAGAAGITSPTG